MREEALMAIYDSQNGLLSSVVDVYIYKEAFKEALLLEAGWHPAHLPYSAL
jgi:hypothetical protein